MMIHEQIKFECLTPCFCAGANQAQAEIRPSAIRGALRWWFRCLGGSPQQEQEAFGGTQPTRASSIQVRVSDVIIKATGQLPKPAQADPLAYILYFASISGGEGANFGQGPRWTDQGSLGPGTTFVLRIRQTRQLSSETGVIIRQSIEAFKHYGSIGLRITRGLGALQAQDITPTSRQALDESLRQKGFAVKHRDRTYNDWKALMKEAGRVLKEEFRMKYGAGGNQKPPQATALGNIKPSRQTSALYLRPIKVGNQLALSAFEAPHDKVLGDISKRIHSCQILEELDF
jgi:CRISPR type III-B/RAMP module RAMP protein Cmr1